MDGNLLDAFQETRYASPSEVRFLGEFLHDFRLPVPKRHHVLRTNEDGAALFLNFAGIVLRIVRKNDVPILRHDVGYHDDILQPLFSASAGNMYAGFYPGVHTPSFGSIRNVGDIHDVREQGYMSQIVTSLGRSGFQLDSENTFNIGYIPQTETDEYPLGKPVFMDMDGITICTKAAEKLAAEIRAVRTLLAQGRKDVAPCAPIQDAHYKDLRQAFHVAATGSRDDKLDLWYYCMNLRNAGMLVTDWADQKVVYREPVYAAKLNLIPRSATSYEKQLRKSREFAPLLS